MHEAVIAPIQELIADSDMVEFALDSATALLPLHAAFDGRQYLIERIAMTYAAPRTGLEVGQDATGALVAGWDVDARAAHEAREIAAVLRTAGVRTERPQTAEQGRTALTAPSSEVRVLHLAGHGKTMPWPRSLDSRVELSPRIAVNAGEWLASGRRAAFVFFNVCNIGRTQLMAGDVSGFPLAFALRGASAVLAASGFVPLDAAQTFAADFYRSGAAGQGSVEAYRSAMTRQIRSGRHPSDWVAYSHFGENIPLLQPQST